MKLVFQPSKYLKDKTVTLQSMDTPSGRFDVAVLDDMIVAAGYGDMTDRIARMCGEVIVGTTTAGDEAVRQLGEYFEGKRKAFELTALVCTGGFSAKCLQVLCEVPYGETWSYRQIAEAAGSPKAYRAAGMANHRNAHAVLIPCHRVIGADGSLTGYAYGTHIKQWLLELESENS